MSQRREHRRRYGLKKRYAYELYRWNVLKPRWWRFRERRLWRNSKPVPPKGVKV